MKIVVKIEGIGTYRFPEGTTTKKALREAMNENGLDPKAWVSEITEGKTVTTVTLTRSTPQKAAAPEPPKMKTVYGDIAKPVDKVIPIRAEHLTTGAVVSGKKDGKEDDAPVGSITFKRSEILDALKVALEITQQKSVMPILHTVKIIAAEGEAVLYATSLDTWWRKVLTAVASTPLQVCIPAKVLYDEIKALPAEVTDAELSFTAHQVILNDRCRIHTSDPEEFPEMPDYAYEPVPVRGMADAFKRVVCAVSTDELRYVLTGVCLDLKGATVVGTDGFRLHYQGVEVKGAPRDLILIPAKPVKMLLKFEGDDSVLFPLKEGEPVTNYIGFSVAGGIVLGKLIEGNYPDYQQVVPTHSASVNFAAAEFLKLLDGAVALVGKQNPITLTVNGELVLSAEDEQGRYEWRIPCESTFQTPIVYHFNPQFLVDAMKAYPADRITMRVPEAGSYGTVMVNDKAIIMPIRV